jgi:very-short-patch-repair endonuclease
MTQRFLDKHRSYGEQLAQDCGVLAPRLADERRQEARRNVRSGRWQRVGRCIVTHSGPLTDQQRAWAAVLTPPGVAALARESSLTAAGVRGVGDQPGLYVVTECGARPAAVAGVTYVQSRHLGLTDVVTASQPLATTPARAVVDAASRATPDRARTLVAMTVQQRKATPREIRAVLRRLSPVRREVLLHVTVNDVEGGAHSLPELRFTTLVRRSDLPAPSRQVVRRRKDGRYYLDVGWDDYAVVAEIDGSHHRDAAQWEADVLRHDELVIGGDRVIRLLSWWVRDRPELVLDLLRRALLSAGDDRMIRLQSSRARLTDAASST